MEKMLCTVGLTLAAFTAPVSATPFVHNFDMHGNYTEYLYSTTNAFVLSEWQPGNPTVYWSPSQANVWGEVVYGYDLPFPITAASVYASILAISANSQTNLSVSPDGTTWTTVAAGYVSPPLTPIDVSTILQGSTAAFVRARLLSDYVGAFSYAQFLRTYEGDIHMAPNVYEFRATPEPSAVVLLLGCVLYCRKAAARGFRIDR